MSNGSNIIDLKKLPKIKLFENISSLIKTFPSIEKYYKDNYKLNKLSDEKLMTYINILFEKHKDYDKFNYFDKVNIIKTQYNNINLLKTEFMHNEFVYGNFKFKKFDNTIALDLLLLKEIQYENEIKGNKNKIKKKIFSANVKNKPLSAKNNIITNKNNKNQTNKNNNINNIHPSWNKIKDPQIINSTEAIKRLSDGLLIWICDTYNNIENGSYLKLLKENMHLTVKCFFSVDEAFNFILGKKKLEKNIKDKLKFRGVFILVSGKLYPEYYQKLTDNINKITFLPISCIFTSLERAKEIEDNRDIYKEINSPFYNKEGVKKDFLACIKSFNKYSSYYKSLTKNLRSKTFDTSYEGCLTFEQIYTKNQLISPFIFNEIMENPIKIIPNNELIKFEQYIQKNFTNVQIQKLIIPMLYIEKFPREIVSKFFARMFTEETLFYYDINKALMKKEKDYNIYNIYNIYIKAMYEGLFLGSLKYSKEDILYRGSRMSRKEVNDIKNPFIEWKKTKNNMLPNFLLYSRTFLSFSKVKNNINKFIGKTDKNYYGVVYVLKNNKSILNKYSSNADIEFLSIYPEEKEVLFFPYTTFCLNDIREEKYENQNCIIIELDYLGKYEYIYNEFKQDENFQNDFINSFYFFGRNYSRDTMKSGLFDINDYIEENKEDEINYNHKGIKLINDLKNILNKLKNLNSELITIRFKFMTGQNYKIKCSPYITIDELITYFLQSFNSKLALKELKEKIGFLHNGQKLNNFGSETINKMKINDLDIIIVVDVNNDIDKKYREEEEEHKGFLTGPGIYVIVIHHLKN